MCVPLSFIAVLQVLASHRILSAPVVVPLDDDAGTGLQYPAEKPVKDVIGFVDLRDVISSYFAGRLSLRVGFS